MLAPSKIIIIVSSPGSLIKGLKFQGANLESFDV